MSKNSTLDPSLFSEYATFCASLVKIINVQLGIYHAFTKQLLIY